MRVTQSRVSTDTDMASNAPKTGGYDRKFVDPPPDKLVCQICLLVAHTPHQVTCCGRVYCNACLNQHKRHSLTCPNCRKRGQDFADIRGEQEVKALKVMCSNTENGCGWVGELRSLDDHLTICGYTFLHCPNKCIENTKEVRMLRRNLDQHLKNKCPNRQYQCPHCKDTGRHCDITTTHLDSCPKVKVSCPNTDCKTSVLRCELDNHRSKCHYEKVPCKYAGIGCGEELLRKDLEQHEIDDAVHLHTAIETVNEQQQEINELKVFKEEQKVITDRIVAGQSGPFVFKTFRMPEYHQHKSSKQEWYSSPFYTHPGGYKMCIEVDANGFDDAAGTHVSVFAYLMKGKNDDNLPWPFTGKVTITLLNQLGDENHHSYTISFPRDSGESNERILDDERAPEGYGTSQFISHNGLDFDAVKNCQYLKDDCLYFQVKVQAAKPVKPWLRCTV